MFHITKPLKTPNFFPASCSKRFCPFNQGKSKSLLLLSDNDIRVFSHHLLYFPFLNDESFYNNNNDVDLP